MNSPCTLASSGSGCLGSSQSSVLPTLAATSDIPPNKMKQREPSSQPSSPSRFLPPFSAAKLPEQMSDIRRLLFPPPTLHEPTAIWCHPQGSMEATLVPGSPTRASPPHCPGSPLWPWSALAVPDQVALGQLTTLLQGSTRRFFWVTLLSLPSPFTHSPPPTVKLLVPSPPDPYNFLLHPLYQGPLTGISGEALGIHEST